jgi:xanthine dehydrogenase accessory factor
MREVLIQMERALESGRPCAHCLVVETRGSTPQKAGAAMLVLADGGQAGTLGGGCVEAEVKQRALRGLTDSSANAEVFSFALDDDYGWDDGLICGGRMTMLVQPVSRTEQRQRAYFDGLRELIESGSGFIEAAVIDAKAGLPVGSRYLFDAEGKIIAALAKADPSPAVRQNLPDLAKRPRSSVVQGVAYLPVLPRICLFVVGGGHVGQAVAELASKVDFDIWVLDDREKFANAERFPSAQRRLVGDIGQTLKQLVAEKEITPSTYCLIVTRGHNHDEEALYHLASTPAGYVGMIGSKRKIKLIFEDLLARGMPEATLAKVHAPLGLTIGSQTVPEIAVSIVAELIGCRNVGPAFNREEIVRSCSSH